MIHVSIREVAPSSPSKVCYEENEDVWLLNLDQVESKSGRVLKEIRGTASSAGSSTYSFDEGNVLYSKLRPYLNKVVIPGKGGIATSELVPLRPDPQKLSREYLAGYLRSPKFVRWVSNEVAGAKMPRVSMKTFWQHKIPLPPMVVQKRIAGILDAADHLRAKRRETLAQLDALLQSTFLELFGACDRPPISLGPPTFGNPKGFRPISSVARMATGHTPDRDRVDYWGGDIPWIGLTEIRDLNGRVAQTTRQNVTEEGIKNSSSVKLPRGTVCFSRTASVGFVTVMGREMATSQDFVNWVCGDKINPLYLMWCLIFSRPYLLSKASGSTHKTIYHRHTERFQVYLPSLDLQRQFAAIVESVEQQKTQHRAHLAELDALFASLQSRAFNGEL